MDTGGKWLVVIIGAFFCAWTTVASVAILRRPEHAQVAAIVSAEAEVSRLARESMRLQLDALIKAQAEAEQEREVIERAVLRAIEERKVLVAGQKEIIKALTNR
jgi:hypothetical protein